MADKIFVIFLLLSLVAVYGLSHNIPIFAPLPFGVALFALYSHIHSL